MRRVSLRAVRASRVRTSTAISRYPVFSCASSIPTASTSRMWILSGGGPWRSGPADPRLCLQPCGQLGQHPMGQEPQQGRLPGRRVRQPGPRPERKALSPRGLQLVPDGRGCAAGCSIISISNGRTSWVIPWARGSAPIWRWPAPERMRSLLLGGLGVHLVEGVGLPLGIADAMEAPSLDD